MCRTLGYKGDTYKSSHCNCRSKIAHQPQHSHAQRFHANQTAHQSHPCLICYTMQQQSHEYRNYQDPGACRRFSPKLLAPMQRAPFKRYKHNLLDHPQQILTIEVFGHAVGKDFGSLGPWSEIHASTAPHPGSRATGCPGGGCGLGPSASQPQWLLRRLHVIKHVHHRRRNPETSLWRHTLSEVTLTIA